MKSKTSRIEQETIIVFNEAEPEALVYTFNQSLIKKLDKLSEERPECVRVAFIGDDGEVKYYIPKKWVKVNAGRMLTEEQRTLLAERLERTRAKK